MSEVNFYKIVGSTGIEHGFLERDGNNWIYQRPHADPYREHREIVKNNIFQLYRNKGEKRREINDKDNIYAGEDLNGVPASIDWENYKVTTKTGAELKLVPDPDDYGIKP